jgi:phosphoglycolate phosphatase-like HAD superfamily hydrolase
MKLSNFKIAMFDWNGTILDDITLSHESALEILKIFAPGRQLPTLEQFRSEMTLNFMQFYRNWGVPDDTTPEELEVYRKKYFENNIDKAKLSDGAMAFMRLCRRKGLKIAVVSGENFQILQDAVFRWFRSRVYLDYVFGGVRIKEDIFRRIMCAENCFPNEVFYVGDSPGDVLAANNVGLHSIALWHKGSYASENKLLLAKPRQVTNSFLDLTEIMK